MISLEGAAHPLCSGVSRRDALKIGTAGLAGLTLASLLQGRAEAATGRGKAKSLVMIHLSGGPPHLDTYDPKPDAPAEIRGEFKAIPTKVDGIQFCEHFPLQAQMADRLAVIRSIHRVLPEEHASSHTCTGWGFTERRAGSDRPCIGSVIARLRGKPDSLLPAYVALRGVNGETGLNAAYLGPNYEPLMYEGPGREDLRLRIDMSRLNNRRRMLDRINAFRKEVEAGPMTHQDVFSQRALEIISSSATYNALDISKETEETRKRYANDHFLRARRLVEAGVQCVALEIGGWDTHSDKFRSMKNLMPATDRAVTGPDRPRPVRQHRHRDVGRVRTHPPGEQHRGARPLAGGDVRHGGGRRDEDGPGHREHGPHGLRAGREPGPRAGGTGHALPRARHRSEAHLHGQPGPTDGADSGPGADPAARGLTFRSFRRERIGPG